MPSTISSSPPFLNESRGWASPALSFLGKKEDKAGDTPAPPPRKGFLNESRGWASPALSFLGKSGAFCIGCHFTDLACLLGEDSLFISDHSD